MKLVIFLNMNYILIGCIYVDLVYVDEIDII